MRSAAVAAAGEGGGGTRKRTRRGGEEKRGKGIAKRASCLTPVCIHMHARVTRTELVTVYATHKRELPRGRCVCMYARHSRQYISMVEPSTANLRLLIQFSTSRRAKTHDLRYIAERVCRERERA